MRKLFNIIKLILISTFFISCNSYQLASYYGDNDGIYVSSNRGIDYKVIFNEYADDYSESDVSISKRLPWGANPESVEVIHNFFPNYGRSYYNPFFHSMAYGYRSPFFYNSFAYELGYPFYGPSNWYFSPYSNSLSNYYWYMMRNSRYYPWNYGRDNYNNYIDESSSSSRLSYSRSNSRRGEKNSTLNGVSKKANSQGMRVSSIYSRTVPYARVNEKLNNRNNNYDDTIDPNLRVIKRNDINAANSSLSSNTRRVNRNGLIPNLNKIKSDAVRKAYGEIRSVNQNKRNFINRSGNYNSRSNSSNYYRNQSSRSNSSYSNGNRVSRPSSSLSTRGGNISSSRSSSSGSRGSSGGSRGSGNIN
tara:strand:- start:1499 stop:2581 length:1083 start_codon:yes stop_codon:yes gene_type:complete